LSGCKFIGGSIAAAGLRVNALLFLPRPAAMQTATIPTVRRLARFALHAGRGLVQHG